MTPAQDQRRRFFGDTRSLKSFGGSLQTSLSLKATSLKAKQHLTLVLPNVLSRSRGRRWTQSGDPDHINTRGRETDIHVEPPLPELPICRVTENMPSTNQTVKTPASAENHDMLSRDKSQRVRTRNTRSRTVIGLFSSAFRSLAPSPGSLSTPTRPSAHITSAFSSKEYRDAALRERGLLPPLEPNPDLSQAERRRDSYLPVLQPPSHEEELEMNGEKVKLSAASKIKQEWEAANKGNTRVEEHMSNGNARCFPSPSSQGQDATLETSLHMANDQFISQPHLEYSSPRSVVPSIVCSGRVDGTRSYIPSDPHLIPLPSSPVESSLLRVANTHHQGSFGTDPDQPTSIPLPPSPALSIGSSARLFLQSSLTALDSPSSSTGIITCESSDSPRTKAPSRFVDCRTPDSLAATPATLDAPISKNNIPIIIETPVEERSFVLVAEMTDEPADAGTTVPDNRSTVSPAPLKPRKTRKRNYTDSMVLSEPKIEHRKSFNPFKRDQTVTPNLDVSPNEATPKKRLSMAVSFHNLRRSFIGPPSSSRPKLPKLNVSKSGEDINVTLDTSSASTQAEQNASSSPRSPMSPKSPGWSPLGHHHRSSPQLAPRKAVSPTFHSTGSILVEAANIEDDEMRRVTELAFL